MRRHSFRPALALLIVLSCAALAAARAKMHFINVGQADSVLVELPKAALLVDAGAEADQRCTAELSHLVKKYAANRLLDVDVLKVSHHGSFNGTTDEWMRATSPRISVISAGVPSVASPGGFHAWFFGHPRESAVAQIERGTGGDRPLVAVTTMAAVRRPRRQRQVSKAVTYVGKVSRVGSSQQSSAWRRVDGF